MKKTAVLLIVSFILLPTVNTPANSDKDLERIYRRNSSGEDDRNAKVVQVVPDGKGHLLVDAVLNGNVHASLTVDTGAPMLCLTANMARKLGFDLENMKDIEEIMLLNGKHKVARVYLKSVDLGGAQQENIAAAVFLEDDKVVADAFNDGLLGLSFLSKFNFTLDGNNSELILKEK